MKKNVWIACWTLFCIAVCPNVVHAAFNSYPELPELVDESDVVCVAKVTNVKVLGTTKIEVTHKDRNGNPVTIDAQNAIADVIVKIVMKGNLLRTTFQVAFFKNVYSGFNLTPFTELSSGENDILFLTTTDNRGVYSLTEPSSNGKSKIFLGLSDITAPPSGLTPLRSILLTMIQTLSGKPKPVVIDCLQRVQSLGYLLYVKPGVYSNEVGVARRLSLNEPLLTDQTAASSLENFIKTQILPPIIELTKNTDNDVTEQAFITAGSLQDVTVIPNLAQIADKNYIPGILGFPSATIGDYRNPVAAVPLIRILRSRNANIRQKASSALGELRDPLALPFLVDQLDDNDAHVFFAVNEALFEITGKPASSVPAGDEQSLQVRDIAFWKKWAAANQDQLTKLRAEFKAKSLASP